MEGTEFYDVTFAVEDDKEISIVLELNLENSALVVIDEVLASFSMLKVIMLPADVEQTVDSQLSSTDLRSRTEPFKSLLIR